MPIRRLLFAFISLAIVFLYMSLRWGAAKANQEEFRKRESTGPKACPSCRKVCGGDKTDIYLLSISRHSQ